MNKQSMWQVLKIFYKKGAVIYGAGIRGKKVLIALEEMNIDVTAVIDRDPEMQMNTLGENVVLSPDDAIRLFKQNGLPGGGLIITPESDVASVWDIFFDYFDLCIDSHDVDFFIMFSKYFIPDNLDTHNNVNFLQARPFNHYYSPYPQEHDIHYLNKMSAVDDFRDINFNLPTQQMVLQNLHIKEFVDIAADDNMRYTSSNVYFAGNDGLALLSMILQYKPNRIIEIGSGFSTALSLDGNEKYFDNRINLTAIEPYPERLLTRLKENDNINIIKSNLQDIPLEIFDTLEENDILFIDSSHVLKPGSDVLFELFLILPRLKHGVIVHIHDIVANFEYPIQWMFNGHLLTEAYAVRALLSGNPNYEILFFVNMHTEAIRNLYEKLEIEYNEHDMPAGGSLWLKKIK